MKRRLLMALAGAILASGCATPHMPSDQSTVWRGRLAVRIDGETSTAQAQSFSAAFELQGSALAGALTLFTPIGTTAAALTWTPDAAVLKANGEIQRFDALDALIKQVLGTEIPVAALFAWLAGQPMNAAGWSADLSRQEDGRILARRQLPTPSAELRVVLDR